MSDRKLREIKQDFEHIIEKVEKLKVNKKISDKNRKEFIAHLKEEFTEALLSLEYIIEAPGYRDAAFEVQESFCLKAKEVDIIKDDKELDEIFMEMSKRKKAKDINVLEEIKNHFKKIISKKPLDLNKLAYVLIDATEIEEPDFTTEKYIVNKLKELGVFNDVYEIFNEIITRAGEKREREEARELKNHESRLRTLEREREKELKKEYAVVSKRAGSFHKTLDAIYKDKPLTPPVFESPGICEKCGYPITDTFYYHDIKTGVVMHTECAKKVLDIKKKIKK